MRGGHGHAHKIPRLIAKAMPNFSARIMFRFQIIFQGSRANMKSKAAPYADETDILLS